MITHQFLSSGYNKKDDPPVTTQFYLPLANPPDGWPEQMPHWPTNYAEPQDYYYRKPSSLTSQVLGVPQSPYVSGIYANPQPIMQAQMTAAYPLGSNQLVDIEPLAVGFGYGRGYYGGCEFCGRKHRGGRCCRGGRCSNFY